MSTHIHINRLVLHNVDGPGDDPAAFAAAFTTALSDAVRTDEGGAAPPTIGTDPARSARAAAGTAANAIRTRLGAATPPSAGPRR
jgi:hypothetical protein